MLRRDRIPDQDLVLSGLEQDLPHASNILDQINLIWMSHSSALMAHPSASFGMWPNVQNTLDSTRTVLQALKEKLQPVANSGRKGGFFKHIAKSWKYGLQVRTLAVYRSHFDAHQKALKVSANMMRM
jgi:hypothetical protein